MSPTTAPNICAAKTRSGEPCKRVAGWGTDHLGYGHCSYHLGTTRDGTRYAARLRSAEYVGERDITPLDAIAEQLRLAAGAEYELRREVARLDSLIQVTNQETGSKRLAFEAVALQEARRWVVDVAEVAHKCGVEERRVQVLEGWADELAPAIQAILERLELTPTQKERAPQVVRAQLLALEGGADG